MNQETPRPRPAHPAPAGALPPGRAHRTIRGAAQWLSATTSRIAGDAHSWMQAVHWVLEAALHPRFCTTTLRVARVLAELNPCRPGVAYLMRRLQLGERMVQYHLAALRETGLLVYVAKGGRQRGRPATASEFARVIPREFDEALGLRTKGCGPGRRVVGIAEAGRRRIAALARKASSTLGRTPRRPRRHCTPMRVGNSGLSSADRNPSPSEARLARWHHISPRTTPAPKPPTKPKRTAKPLNAVGRRFKLAAELVRLIPWLHGAAVPRVAWLAREVSDAGWTAQEVVAWLNLLDAPASVQRPAAFLAHRLRGATAVWPTAAQRSLAVEADRDSRRSAAARHRCYDHQAAEGPPPRLAKALHEGLRTGLAAYSARQAALGLDDLSPVSLEPAGPPTPPHTAEARHVAVATTPGWDHYAHTLRDGLRSALRAARTQRVGTQHRRRARRAVPVTADQWS